jgi:hypothetical protein
MVPEEEEEDDVADFASYTTDTGRIRLKSAIDMK